MASFNKFKNVLMLAFDWILYGAACLVRLRPGTVEERGKALQNCSPEQLHTVPGFLAVPPIKNCSFPAGVAGHCQVTVAQPRFQQVDSSMNVSLPCSFSASGCSSPQPEVLWFRFLTSTHQGLCTPGCTDHQKYKVHSAGNNILLQIKDLTEDDSAVYICGIAFSDSSPLSKQTGDGTVLTVTGSGKQLSHGKLISMIIASTLLFLYSSAVLISFVVYKLKPKLQKKSGKDQTTENCKINSGRKIFQAIAQELQKQRYAQHQQQPEDLEDDTVYQNR